MNSIPIHDLAAAFGDGQVKQRRGNYGQTLSYVEASTVIARLNDALEGQWSFQVVDTELQADEVIVRGRLTIGDSVREQFGGSRITRHKDTGDMISLADDLKAAASDALKKCATMAGVGLYLYGDGGTPSPAVHPGRKGAYHSAPDNKRNGRQAGNGHNGHHKGDQHGSQSTTPYSGASEPDRVTNAQIAHIFDAAREIGVPQKDVIAMARETFQSTISQLTPYQADDLIAMIGQAA